MTLAGRKVENSVGLGTGQALGAENTQFRIRGNGGFEAIAGG